MLHRLRWKSTLLACLVACSAACGQPANPPAPATDVARASHWLGAMPLQTTLPARLRSVLRQQDVVSYIAPGMLYPAARNIGLQCQGVNAGLGDVPKRAVQANTQSGDTEPRFGEADAAGVRVFRLEINARDLLPPDLPPRCELLAYPMPASALPQAQNFWFAFSFWANDWAGTTDEQLIAQFHIQEPRKLLLNPFFALVVRGDELRVELRHNARDIPDKASTRLVTPRRLTMPTRRWVTAVVQARLSNDPDQGPFVRLWLDGEQIVDYAGPVGYVLPPGAYAYPKVGLYHWTVGNPWDLKVPSRALLVGAMLTVRDASDRYNAEQIQGLVAAVPGQR